MESPSAPSGQRRAKAGGEIAPNGEFYEGGKFIATTQNAKRQRATGRATGRVEVERGQWATCREGCRPLWPWLAGVEVYDRATNTFVFNEDLRGDNYASPEALAARRARIAAWNNGLRWARTETGSFE